MTLKTPPSACHPLTIERWNDFETLFGKNGACGGCWCMWWKLTQSEFNRQKGDANRLAIRARVQAGPAPGLLAYRDQTAIGWCAVEPRENYPKLNRSRILKKIDELAVWSITCFFIDRRYRRQGVSETLLLAAVEFVREHGGKILEGYPLDSNSGPVPDANAFYGLASTFMKTGFEEVARRSPTRPMMRRYLSDQV